MLRVEFYTVMEGIMVRAWAVPTALKPVPGQERPGAVQRIVQQGDIEDLGYAKAVQDAFLDMLRLYPELLEGAIR